MLEIKEEDAYRLLELRALEGIKEKFWHRLRRIGLYLTIPIGLAAFFGVKSFGERVKGTIDDRVKIEVNARLANLTDEVQKTVDAQRAKLESQIEKTTEASIFARAATEEARRTLHELRTEARASETSVVQLRNDATSAIKELTTRFNSQKKEMVKLNSYVNNYYDNKRTEKLKFNQTPHIVAIPLTQKQTLLFMRVSKIPIASSITLQFHLFAQPPDSYFVLKDNIIGFLWADTIKRLEQHFLYITYAVNPETGEGFKSLTIKDGQIYGDEKQLFGLQPTGS